MTKIYLELKGRGIQAQRSLLPLLQHSDPDVRLNAATLALEFAPASAEPILEALQQFHGMTGYEAGVALSEWRNGALKFPPYTR